jgi:pterin-4a-carbinolamine dehydratase
MKSLLNFIDDRFIVEGTNRDPDTSSVRGVLGSLVESTMPRGLPIEVETSKWVTKSNPERLVRRFVFESFDSLMFFLNELLSYQEEKMHHADITVSNREIMVSTYTHNIDQVTELDLSLAGFCDEIYEDVQFMQIARRRGREREIESLG